MIRINIPINKQIVSRTMGEFGTRAQVDMVIEECAELIQAIQDHKSTRDDLDDVINDAAAMIKKILKQRRVALPRSDVSFGSTYQIADEMAAGNAVIFNANPDLIVIPQNRNFDAPGLRMLHYVKEKLTHYLEEKDSDLMINLHRA